MENLKNTINKTETLLNNVKSTKDKINKTVVRGGGITSKSLSEIHDNIKSMISKNYKKIAINNPGNIVTFGYNQFLDVDIKLNLSFNPSRVILIFGDAKTGVSFSEVVDSKYNINIDTIFSNGYLRAYIKSFSKEKVTVSGNISTIVYQRLVKEIIAIE